LANRALQRIRIQTGFANDLAQTESPRLGGAEQAIESL